MVQQVPLVSYHSNPLLLGGLQQVPQESGPQHSQAVSLWAPAGLP